MNCTHSQYSHLPHTLRGVEEVELILEILPIAPVLSCSTSLFWSVHITSLSIVQLIHKQLSSDFLHSLFIYAVPHGPSYCCSTNSPSDSGGVNMSSN